MTSQIGIPAARPVVPNCKLLPLLERCIIDCWVTDRSPALQALVSSVQHALPGGDPKKGSRKSVSTAVYDVLHRLERAALYRPQAAKNGVRLSLGETAGNGVHWFNLSAIRVDDASVADMARAYLSSVDADNVTDAQRARFRTAMRLLLALPEQCSDGLILSAAGRLSLAQVVELPNRVMDMATAAGQTKQSAKNLRTAVRAAMRYAAERRACPIVFRSTPMPGDAWVSAMNTHFPLAESGPTTHGVLALRKGMKLLATTADEAREQGYLDHVVSPESITRADGAAIVNFIRTKLGKEYDARSVRAVLNKLSRLGVGKLGDAAALTPFQIQTSQGVRAAIYLRDRDGSAGSHNWTRMLDIMTRAGLPQETCALLRWYGEWVTLPPEAFLAADCVWPPVLNRHLLSRSSLDNRSNDIRAWIGCAIQQCGFEPSTLTPQRLFGELFDQIGKRLIGWWMQRQAVLRTEGRKHGAATRGTLHHIIVSAGIVAYAGYIQARHQRGFAAEVTDTAEGGRINVLAETMADKTPAESRLLHGYGDSLKLAGTVNRLVSAKGKRGRKSVKEEVGAYQPEFKDIRKIMEFTPPAWWIQLLDSMHDRVRAAVRDRKDSGREFYLLVQHAWELGLFISTGFRGEEACRLERGTHLKDGDGRIALAAAERKNAKRQTADLQARYVPPDIHELYLTRALPWFCRGQHEEIAARHEQRRRGEADRLVAAALARVRDHSFLVVDTNGAAPAALQSAALRMAPIDTNASDRSDRAFKSAVGRHGTRWKAAMMRRAVEAGLRLPDDLTLSFGRHCIRGAFGYAIYQTQGEVAAANYLGDSPETVRLAYTAIEGINVDVSLVADFAVRRRGIQTGGAQEEPRPAAAVAAGAMDAGLPRYLEKEAEVRADLRAGHVSREQYDALVTQYKRLYLGAA